MRDAYHAGPDGQQETILNDRYRLLESIGDGGMGRVYAAEHITLGKRVAIKVLREELSQVDGNVERFIQEARAASMTNHPNVVDITDVGRTPAGTVFFVMEFLEGEELAVLMHREKRLPWPRVQSIAIQVARGLEATHRAGVVHRDMKPANIFMSRTADGALQVKLLDFGIAKLHREGRRPLTGHGSVFGTARYMSPEQAAGREVDARTDVYSVGVILYEMLTGDAPFDGDNFIQVANRHINDPVPAMSSMAPDAHIPEVVCDLVMRALDKDPDKRFQSMAGFEAAILGASFESTVATANPLLMDGVDRTIVYQAELGRLAREAANMPAAPAPAPAPARAPVSAVPPEERTVIRQRPRAPAKPVFAGSPPPPPDISQPVFGSPAVPRPPAMADMPSAHPSYPPSSELGTPQVRSGQGAFFAASAQSEAYGEGNAVVLPAGAAVPSSGPTEHRTLPPVNALGAMNPSTAEHAQAPEGLDTVEFSLNVPRQEVSRNVLVILVAAISVLSIVGGIAVWALFFDEHKPVEEEFFPTVVQDQPQPAIPVAPKPTRVADVGPAPIPMPVPGDPPVQRKPEVPRDAAVAPVPEPPEPRKPRKPRKAGGGAKTASRGFGKARSGIKACGQEHGALEGTRLKVTFDVSGGRATSVSVQRPYTSTPLGRCIAKVVQSKSRFGTGVKEQSYTQTVSL